MLGLQREAHSSMPCFVCKLRLEQAEVMTFCINQSSSDGLVVMVGGSFTGMDDIISSTSVGWSLLLFVASSIHTSILVRLKYGILVIYEAAHVIMT